MGTLVSRFLDKSIVTRLRGNELAAMCEMRLPLRSSSTNLRSLEKGRSEGVDDDDDEDDDEDGEDIDCADANAVAVDDSCCVE